MKFTISIIRVLPFLNNPKDLDPSYKMDLDFGDCFGREKTLSYSQRNTVILATTAEAPSFEFFKRELSTPHLVMGRFPPSMNIHPHYEYRTICRAWCSDTPRDGRLVSF